MIRPAAVPCEYPVCKAVLLNKYHASDITSKRLLLAQSLVIQSTQNVNIYLAWMAINVRHFESRCLIDTELDLIVFRAL
jgi:hypothetical protein